MCAAHSARRRLQAVPMSSKKESLYPRLDRLGWESKDVTEVIDLGLEKLRRTTDRAEKRMRRSRERLCLKARVLTDEMDAVTEGASEDDDSGEDDEETLCVAEAASR